MNVSDVKAQAKEVQLSLPRIDLADLAAEQLKADLRDFFERVPEPPAYRRKDDPQLPVTTVLLTEAALLWARILQLEADGSLAVWEQALEGHVRAMTLTLTGQLETAEQAWLGALQREKEAGTLRRAWSRSDEIARPVFDKLEGESRYDARPAHALKVALPCPACREKDAFEVSARVARHSLRCRRCGVAFEAYLAEVRSFETKPLGRGRRRFSFRLEEPGGLPSRLDFDSLVEGELPAARGDLLAFVYSASRDLKAVSNLSSGRLLWVQPGSLCFIATMAFGEGAVELDAFRAFRDRRLLSRWWGRQFVAGYYRWGPPAARLLGATEASRAVTRGLLKAIHRALV